MWSTCYIHQQRLMALQFAQNASAAEVLFVRERDTELIVKLPIATRRT